MSAHTIHFIKADDRSCKYGEPMTGKTYRVTVDPNDVTCPQCQNKDTLTLSPQGMRLVRAIEATGKGFLTPEEYDAFMATEPK